MLSEYDVMQSRGKIRSRTGASDAKLANAGVKSGSFHSETRGGAGRTGDHPIRFPQKPRAFSTAIAI